MAAAMREKEEQKRLTDADRSPSPLRKTGDSKADRLAKELIERYPELRTPSAREELHDRVEFELERDRIMRASIDRKCLSPGRRLQEKQNEAQRRKDDGLAKKKQTVAESLATLSPWEERLNEMVKYFDKISQLT
ncbi:unnamed protein product, partial [Amoebophrya sp. A25]|eukprot:GSA25T00006966001.1